MEKATRALQTAPSAPSQPSAPSAPAPAIPTLFLKTDRHLTRIGIDSILYIESLKDYIRVYTTAGDYLCHQSLTEITGRLPPEKFLRVHRSYTLSLDKIDQVRQHCAHIGSRTIPISRAHRQDLYRRLGK